MHHFFRHAGYARQRDSNSAPRLARRHLPDKRFIVRFVSADRNIRDQFGSKFLRIARNGLTSWNSKLTTWHKCKVAAVDRYIRSGCTPHLRCGKYCRRAASSMRGESQTKSLGRLNMMSRRNVKGRLRGVVEGFFCFNIDWEIPMRQYESKPPSFCARQK
jgi:hypothetical protein